MDLIEICSSDYYIVFDLNLQLVNRRGDVIVDNIEKITATDKFRQELIANISHDLRTPLSITQGYKQHL